MVAFTTGARRGANVLVLALSALLIIGLLGATLMDRSMHAGRSSRWSRDHLDLRLLAESAVEELFAQLSVAAATPGTPAFERLRRLPPGGTFKPVILDLRPTVLEAEIARSNRPGAKPTLTAVVTIVTQTRTGPDPLERTGLVRFEVTAHTGGGLLAATERVRVEHTYRVSRVTPPRPLDQVGLFVGLCEKATVPSARPGSSAFATLGKTPRTLEEIFALPAPDGFRGLATQYQKTMAQALGSLAPQALAQRAHYVLDTPARWTAFLATREGHPVDGLFHLASKEPLRLAFTGFRGKCLISSEGPIEVGDVTLADPTRDALTIVSADHILVKGRDVQAALVSVANGAPSVLFATQATIRGSVISTRFPARSGLSPQEFGGCKIARAVELNSGVAREVAPDANLMSRYVCCFSPHPVAQEHLREGQGWSAW